MPLYHDVHSDLVLPDGVVAGIKADADAGQRDKFGVLQHALFYNPEGHVVCILDAPNPDAVRDHHTALGVSCGDVHEVVSM